MPGVNKMGDKVWKVYLSGEIHTNWREELIAKVGEEKLPIEFSSPQTNHERSDDCGVKAFGHEDQSFWKDHKGARLNALRNTQNIQESDLVIVRFGDKYRQWNAAFDAGFVSALGLPYLSFHGEELDHALKEVDSASHGVARSVDQLVTALRYITKGE